MGTLAIRLTFVSYSTVVLHNYLRYLTSCRFGHMHITSSVETNTFISAICNKYFA